MTQMHSDGVANQNSRGANANRNFGNGGRAEVAKNVRGGHVFAGLKRAG